ncbi:dihydrodipicolinate synthase family protein [Paracoccus mutanolyticus]|uniref:dihydrodipicolinate synthase family protein n=1 Tax=Paracoccus mutanolyticus TaxID=1499308 RepID=UPI001CB93A35|nr:dihydrodipicolinate synthase family protein [Paracoccus mutanolyticus]
MPLAILVSNGNTGEFYALTTDEAERAVTAAAEQISGRVPLLAGIGLPPSGVYASAGARRSCRAAAG